MIVSICPAAESHGLWPWMNAPFLARMSPHSGVSQVSRLRAEAHFGAQARALPVELDI
jgi:hypothetical protein